MAYNLTTIVADATEIKVWAGNSTSRNLILMLQTPVVGGWSPWLWDWNSTATPDDINIIAPTARIGLNGRWIKMANFDIASQVIAGDGLDRVGRTLLIDGSEVMTVSGATAMMETMEDEIHTLTPMARKLMIGHTELDLSQDREFIIDYADVHNKPTLFDGDYDSLTNRPDLFDGDYQSLENKPTLFSGAYVDLTGKPVLFDGNYNSLSNKPILFSGSYLDLINKPTIPSAQVSSDWNATSGVTQVLNKPTIPTNTNQLTNGAGFITASSLPAAPVFNNAPARTLNTAYTISATKNASVSYTITLTTAVSLLNLNSAASAFLEISTNGTTWLPINSAGLTRVLGVSISVGVNDSQVVNIQGQVPAGYQARLRTVVAGGGTATFTSGQEVTY